MDEEKLIVEVEKNDILYDPKHPYYKDTGRKDKVWTDISQIMGVDVDTCKNKWKALRDGFVKNRRKSSLPSGSAGGSQKEWKYEKIMSFLLPYLQLRSSKSSLAKVARMEEGERPGTPHSFSESEGGPSTPGPSQRSTTPSPAPSVSLPSTSAEAGHRSRSPREPAPTSAPQQSKGKDSRRSYKPQHEDLGDRLISILKDPAPTPHMPDTPLAESYHFALSLVPILAGLEKKFRQRAKVQMLNLLQDLEDQQEQQISAPHYPSGMQPHYYQPQLPHPPVDHHRAIHPHPLPTPSTKTPNDARTNGTIYTCGIN